MPYSIDVSATSSARPELVFDHLATAVTWSEWGGLPMRSERARAGDPEPDGIGSIRRIGRFREEVVAFDPPKRYSYTMPAGIPVDGYRADVTLRPHASGTAIRWQARFEQRIPGTGWLCRVILAGLVRRLAGGLARHCDRCDTECRAHRS